MTYPIAEIFESVQGESTFQGTRMAFVRLAGCNVGKPRTRFDPVPEEEYQEVCTDWDGHKFLCDTNYRKAFVLSVAEIMETPEVQHNERVSITGGEPLIHDLFLLADELLTTGKYIHLETSGTLPLPAWVSHPKVWVTVSPKRDCLVSCIGLADDIRVMVDAAFDEARFDTRFGSFMSSVWLSPVNGGRILSQENMARCVEIQKRHPQVRISVQLHKILGVR